MKVTPDHWLDIAKRMPLEGGNPMNIRRFLVMHYTEGWSAASAVDWWKQPGANGACAHIVIDRDGSIIQCRPFNRTCGHAGESTWTDPQTGQRFNGLNSCSIGIELVNCGDLKREKYPETMGFPLADTAIPRLSARHKNGGPVAQWERYPAAQLTAASNVARVLIERYNLDDVMGHDDIAPRRKTDPGPAFPMIEFRRTLGFPKPTHPKP